MASQASLKPDWANVVGDRTGKEVKLPVGAPLAVTTGLFRLAVKAPVGVPGILELPASPAQPYWPNRDSTGSRALRVARTLMSRFNRSTCAWRTSGRFSEASLTAS